MKKNRKGLTLIELLAVIAIIAILFVLLIPQISNAIEKSREAGVMTDFRDYEIALKSYFTEQKKEAKRNEQFNKYVSGSLKVSDSKSIKNNPYGNKYHFFIISEDIIEIYTFNNDKTPKKYSLIVSYYDGEITSSTSGFANNIEGANAEVRSGDFSYVKNNNTDITITRYFGSAENLTVPATIDSLNVKTIGRHSLGKLDYWGRNEGATLKTVTFSNGIEVIESSSFRNNQITSVTFSNSVKKIGQGAFQQNQITNVIIPSSVETIGNGTFSVNPLATYKLLGNSTIGVGSFPSTAVRQ